ncbi:MAG: hypothetical protein NTV23_11365 [Propionibacteriales bacterium]|nr:hypothetical protein [Propionibacteriales bacterium]
MKALAAFLVAFLAALALPPDTAAAAPQGTLRTGDVVVTVNRPAIRSGGALVVTGSARTSCAWIIEWNGERRTTTGRQVVSRFVAPDVRRPTRLPVRATCFSVTDPPPRTPPAAAGRPAAERTHVAVPSVVRDTLNVVVLPTGSVSPPGPGDGDAGNGLPGTGGPARWLLWAGAAALLAGVGLVLGRPQRLLHPARR